MFIDLVATPMKSFDSQPGKVQWGQEYDTSGSAIVDAVYCSTEGRVVTDKKFCFHSHPIFTEESILLLLARRIAILKNYNSYFRLLLR